MTDVAADAAAARVAAAGGADQTPAVQLVGVRKHFGDVVAVAGIDLSLRDGEFFTLLGPSGSGKTTVLRMIAGFETPTAGAILLHGRDVTSLPPYDRDVNTVFQDYALFPHLTVAKNVEYGLKVKKVPRAERRRRVAAALDSVRLGLFGGRRPSELSGGQRQRVALARALVNRPRVLLLDEPLGALDLKLREEMQVELKALQHEVGITFVFVTHDQHEALAMSDRIAVFNEGRVDQVGTPREVYERPSTTFVAGFVGTTNFLAGDWAARLLAREGVFTVRPEHLRILRVDGPVLDGEVTTSGTVADVQYQGSETRVRVRLDDGSLLTATTRDLGASATGAIAGDPVRLAFHPDHLFRLDPPDQPPKGE